MPEEVKEGLPIVKQDISNSLLTARIVELGIDRRDLISVGISRIEQATKTKIKELEQSRTEAITRKEAFEARLTESEEADKIIEEFKGFAAKLELGELTFTKTSHVGLDRTRKVQLSITTNKGNVGKGSLNSSVICSLSDPQLNSALDDAIKDINELDSRIIGLKKKIANMPALERAIAANIVTAQLQKSAEGQEVVSLLEGMIPLDIESYLDKF